MYNLDCVLFRRARRGVLRSHLPLVVIAGQTEGTSSDNSEEKQEHDLKQQNKERLRWVSGDLIVPDACGDRFHYSIKDVGHFHNDNKNDKDRSVEQALSLYIKAILFGLIDATIIYRKLADGKIPLASSASGQPLMIGGVALDLPLCASPIEGVVVIKGTSQVDHLNVSQRELFKGEMNVFAIHSK